ncbi:MAG: sigma factor-like helix-turn-helix DNA-binding protein [Luteolibacter sp.]
MTLFEKQNSATDLDLIAAMNTGDEAAFEILYLRYREWVVSLARKFTGCESLANDVLQETFLYFLKKFPGFVLTSQLKTFLYPAVKNHSLNAIGKVKKFQSGTEGQNILDHLVAPSCPPGFDGDFEVVLSSLSEDHQEILMLRFVDGLSIAEIAEAAGIPLGTAKSRLHHALSRLREDHKTREYFIS